MLNILHIDGEATKVSAGAADGVSSAAEATETAIKRNIRSKSGRTSANAIYDRARGIYFRARSTHHSKPISIF